MPAEPPRGPRPAKPSPSAPEGLPAAADPLSEPLVATSGPVTGTGHRGGWLTALASGVFAVLLGAAAARVVDTTETDPGGTGATLASGGAGRRAPGDYRLVGETLGGVSYGVGLPRYTYDTCRSVNKAIAQVWTDGSTREFLGGLRRDRTGPPRRRAPRRDDCL